MIWHTDTSLVPRLPLSFSHLFPREYYMRKIEGEGEPGTEPRPPVATWPSGLRGHPVKVVVLFTHGYKTLGRIAT